MRSYRFSLAKTKSQATTFLAGVNAMRKRHLALMILANRSEWYSILLLGFENCAVEVVPQKVEQFILRPVAGLKSLNYQILPVFACVPEYLCVFQHINYTMLYYIILYLIILYYIISYYIILYYIALHCIVLCYIKYVVLCL